MERFRPRSFLPLPTLALTACVLPVLLGGCSDLGDPLHTSTAPAAQCEITPAALDFGSVAVGDSAHRSFRIANLGNASLAAEITETCPDYTLVSGGGAHAIAPGETLVVDVRYLPTATGDATCTVQTGLQCSTVSLTANGAVPVTSFATRVQPIFTTSCALSGCHAGRFPEGDLDLTTGHSYGALVGVMTAGYAPALRVAAGDTAASVLYVKVTRTSDEYGFQMPYLRPALSAADQATIRQWILEGAHDN